jgi:hypothetical protein
MITAWWTELLLVTFRWLDRVITDGNWSNCFIFIVLNSRHDGVNINIRHHQVRNLVLISCTLEKNLPMCMFISTPISSGLRSSPTVGRQSLNILMSFSVLRFVLTFFISAVPVCNMFLVTRLLCLLTYHNDVIDVGQNNRLFSPGTDMDRAHLRLSTMQKGTYYVQICDDLQVNQTVS